MSAQTRREIIGYMVYSAKDGVCGLTRYEPNGPDVLCLGGPVAMFKTRAAARRAIKRTHEYAEREQMTSWPTDHRIAQITAANDQQKGA